jgi:hypothetical protein
MSKINKEEFLMPSIVVFAAKQGDHLVECVVRPTDIYEQPLATEVVFVQGASEVVIGYFEDTDRAIDACEVFATGFAFNTYEVGFIKETDNGSL